MAGGGVLPTVPGTAPDGSLVLATETLRLRRTLHGLVLYPVRDEFIGRSLDLYGEWSPGDAEVLAPYLRPGATVLDLGANLGTFALSVAQAVGPNGTVLAFEPVAATYRLLVANLALNGLAQVEARREVVGARAGRATVPVLDHARGGNYGASAVGAEGSGESVPVVTIDSLELAACQVLKADVEGSEFDVLAGAERTIRRHRPVLFLENEEPSLSGPLLERLLGLDYRLWWHSPPLYRPDNFLGSDENVFPTYGSLNVLGLPREARHPEPEGLRAVAGSDDWPAWWPDWSAQH